MLKAVIVATLCIWAVSETAPENRIIGGRPNDIRKHPYLVSIQYLGEHDCGGSIISNRVVLTAAHCVGMYKPSTTTVVAGTTYLSKPNQIYRIEAAIAHPRFDEDENENDIGFVIISGRFEFNDLVQIINLHTAPVLNAVVATLAGWGKTKTGYVDHLQEIDLITISERVCERHWEEVLHGNQVCTLNEEGQGACMGDSGGALVFMGRQTGIVSFGKEPCAQGVPDVFTDVSYFLDYIKETVDKYQ